MRRDLRWPPTRDIVDRDMKLSNGEYDVHYIGVNWPQAVFVNKDFNVSAPFNLDTS